MVVLTFSINPGYQMGRLADAEREFRAAVALEPAFTPSWLGIAEICTAMRRLGDAEAVVQKVMAIESATPNIK